MTLELSSALRTMVDYVERSDVDTLKLRAVLSRSTEFGGLEEARLTGIGMDPVLRRSADIALDKFWDNGFLRKQALSSAASGTREVIIGAGYHAAVYAASRVLSGFPRPLVLEKTGRVGGTFGMTGTSSTFWLNSRNRPGNAASAGDALGSLNYLPGAPIQAANLGMQEFQGNADMGFVVRLTLAQYADVVVNAPVIEANGGGIFGPVTLTYENGGAEVALTAGRVIDARGLGIPVDYARCDGNRILTFPQFMQRMTEAWPLRNIKRVAVVGDGDSGKCAVEAFLGIGPQPSMAIAALDHVERIDWYATGLPQKCKAWRNEQRGRYQALGHYLRRDAYGSRRLNIIARRVTPTAIPNGALMGTNCYDLAVMCTGNVEDNGTIGLEPLRYSPFYVSNAATMVAKKDRDANIYRVGPHARIPFDNYEVEDGLANIPQNAVAMFRTGPRTAALAAALPAIAEPSTVDPDDVVAF
jgi:hypothetical protein